MFDAHLWKVRAREHFSRSVSKGAKRSTANTKFTNDLLAIRGLSKLILWCNDRSINVNFIKASGASYVPAKKTIEINCHYTMENQLFALLHECGHFLILESGGARFAKAWKNHGKTLEERVALIDEEYEAWQRGRMLAKRLKIHLNKKNFEREVALSLHTYFRWANGG